MEVRYDPKEDILTVIFREGFVAESDEDKPGIILDYDEKGDLMGLEILDASRRIPDVTSVHFQVASSDYPNRPHV